MMLYYLYRVGEFLAVHLPRKAAYAVAVFISDIHYFFAPKDKREVAKNLTAIFPEKSPREIAMIRVRMFRNFAKYLVDFFRFATIDKNFVKKYVTVENEDILKKAFENGKGVICITGHIGNWELSGAVVALLGYPVWAIALSHKNKKINDFFNAQRALKNVTIIPLGKAVRQCLGLLRANKLVAILADREFTNSGIPLPFFSRTMLLPKGPAALAFKTGAVLVPSFLIRNADDTFTLRFENSITVDGELPDPPPSNDASAQNAHLEAHFASIIEQYKPMFEHYIRHYPDQWFMFRQFWIS